MSKQADEGDANAQMIRGVKYEFGTGVQKDYVQADMWYRLAAARGSDAAVKSRDDLETKMTPAQIAEAKRLASEWKPASEVKKATPATTTSPVGPTSPTGTHPQIGPV